MADKSKRNFMDDSFDPDNITPEEVPEAIGAIATTIGEACAQCFPTNGKPKRAELVACALLTVAVRYALEFEDPIAWLRKQVVINEAHQKAEKASQN